jgi:hypothetical protein
MEEKTVKWKEENDNGEKEKILFSDSLGLKGLLQGTSVVLEDVKSASCVLQIVMLTMIHR